MRIRMWKTSRGDALGLLGRENPCSRGALRFDAPYAEGSQGADLGIRRKRLGFRRQGAARSGKTPGRAGGFKTGAHMMMKIFKEMNGTARGAGKEGRAPEGAMPPRAFPNASPCRSGRLAGAPLARAETRLHELLEAPASLCAGLSRAAAFAGARASQPVVGPMSGKPESKSAHYICFAELVKSAILRLGSIEEGWFYAQLFVFCPVGAKMPRGVECGVRRIADRPPTGSGPRWRLKAKEKGRPARRPVLKSGAPWRRRRLRITRFCLLTRISRPCPHQPKHRRRCVYDVCYLAQATCATSNRRTRETGTTSRRRGPRGPRIACGTARAGPAPGPGTRGQARRRVA